MIEWLIAGLISAEAAKYAVSRNEDLIKLDSRIADLMVSKYGVRFGTAYITVIGPLIEELGFRLMPWFLTHSLIFVVLTTITWWLAHLDNFRLIRAGSRVKTLYIMAVGLGGLSYFIGLLINPVLPVIQHIINNTYSLAMVRRHVKTTE